MRHFQQPHRDRAHLAIHACSPPQHAHAQHTPAQRAPAQRTRPKPGPGLAAVERVPDAARPRAPELHVERPDLLELLLRGRDARRERHGGRVLRLERRHDGCMRTSVSTQAM
jgi:hypothetical protein